MKALMTIKKTMELSVENFIINIQNIIISYHNTLSYKSLTGIIYLKARKLINLVKPSTVLYKWNCIGKNRWIFPPKQKSKPGRPPISMKIRTLIIEIKKLNRFWGIRRISGELEKINIEVSKDTVRRVIQKGRKDGEILPTGSWKKFINAHIQSLFCCDFLCIETVFTKRIYVFFIMQIKTRKIVQYGITTNPTIRFVRNQLISFMFDRPNEKTHLIHDNSGELKYFDYESLGITEVKIPPYSPNLNAYAERFVRSAKSECFDHFIVFTEQHTRNLMREYVKYYNKIRPHQGIGNKLPDKTELKQGCKIKKESVLFGLYTSYSLTA